MRHWVEGIHAIEDLFAYGQRTWHCFCRLSKIPSTLETIGIIEWRLHDGEQGRCMGAISSKKLYLLT